jgi:hypothetical protein
MSVSTKEPTQDQGTDVVADSSTEQLSTVGNARRRFAKRAGVGSGVLLTLVSQPGMASVVCKSPSRNMSVASSAHPGEVVQCSGMGPVAWCDCHYWPCTKDATKFGQIFPCGGNSYGDKLLKSVLSASGTDQTTEFGKALVATYLNVMSGRISFLTLEDVLSMFTAIQSNLQYKATPTVTWNIAQVTTYLKSTYTGS